MPYYVGEGEPEWDEYIEKSETDWFHGPPPSLFKYNEPWQPWMGRTPFRPQTEAATANATAAAAAKTMAAQLGDGVQAEPGPQA